MKFTPLVALHPPRGGLVLAGAELAEVLGRFGDRIGKEVEFDSAQWFTCGRWKKEADSLAPYSLILSELCRSRDFHQGLPSEGER